MTNIILLIGNLGRDPELQVTQDGRKITKFHLATSSSWKDASGEWHQKTQWHQVVIFKEKTALWVKDVLKKGDPILVLGALTYHRWEDPRGYAHHSAQVIVSGQSGQIQDLHSQRPRREFAMPEGTEDTTDFEDDPMEENDEEEDSFEVPNKNFPTLH